MAVFAALDRILPMPDLVAQGGADGVDRAARDWCDERGIVCVTFHAPWSIGRSAGPRRSACMLRVIQPDLVLAFPGGKGTEKTVELAESMGLVVRHEP